MGIALYAGLRRGGVLVAQIAGFSSLCWRAVLPPLVGYLQWQAGPWTIETIPARCDTITFVDVFLGPKAQLEWGLKVALTDGLAVGVLLGGFVYGLGGLCRHLRRDDPSTRSWID